MGSSTYSRDDAAARSTLRSSIAKDKGISYASAAFAYDHDIKTGVRAAKVHDTLSPHGVKIRESRDSAAHPVAVPIAVCLDTTGSMASVPAIIQEKLSHLMGAFLDDKASGKKYLGEGYPAIMIAAVDDYDAMGGTKGEGCIQIGQFESGIEIDDNLTNIWLTRNGGGTYQESYDLFLYMLANKTAHDHWDKRGRRGYAFIIGDEMGYPKVSKEQIHNVIGDTIQADIPLAEIVRQAQERYNVFFVTPNMTSHYGDPKLQRFWVDLLGQQNVIKLDQPEKICECIVGAVAICENHIGADDISTDLGFDSTALVPLARAGAGVSRYSADGLPAVAGSVGGVGGVERL
jgi:hypothetical protein